jgi:CDP-diacylglycerol--glycerol-3-phosphate 3-phosphatidyltransferase
MGLDAPALEDQGDPSGDAMNLPNLLSVARIALIPIFIAVFVHPTPLRSAAAAAIFIVAAVTDLIDGYIARRWQQVTDLGKLLDPLADKLLILAALVLLVEQQRVAAWLAIVLIGRELAVTGLRAIAASERIIIAADQAGKLKVLLQIIAITFLILNYDLPAARFDWIGTTLLWVSMVLAVASAIQYGVRFYQALGRVAP